MYACNDIHERSPFFRAVALKCNKVILDSMTSMHLVKVNNNEIKKMATSLTSLMIMLKALKYFMCCMTGVPVPLHLLVILIVMISLLFTGIN